ncbi:flagellar motor stator protein MotA [Castellaniella caeni]|uniref:flagellar motor stator protein MotA n=1 Tax=Castellaniella caeni TaxID=266123 RepID=UPI00082A13B2|nr:flagellar motor stator protein MotA [Castellaniella caeni]
MFIILGYLIVAVAVAVSFLAGGGHMGALYQPFEFLLIGGCAIGAYVGGSNGASIKLLIEAFPKAIKRNPYGKSLYMDLLALLYTLLNKARRDGLMSVEGDIEEPQSSAIFAQYPQILKDAKLMEFLTDYLRIMISGNMNPFEIETLMDQEIEALHSEHNTPINAVRAVADGLPAFGIVAAVLGVVHALSAVDQPPAVLADLIAKAMVGTFLGILLSYGFAAPFAAAVERQSVAAVKVLECIKVTLLASMNGYPPPLAVEFGRKILFSASRPSFSELDAHVRQSKSQAAK